MKNTGRSFSLDDVDAPDEALPEIDDFATSKPQDDVDDERAHSRLPAVSRAEAAPASACHHQRNAAAGHATGVNAQ